MDFLSLLITFFLGKVKNPNRGECALYIVYMDHNMPECSINR